MKVFYDHEILISQRFGGISRYFYEIISEIREKHRDIRPVIKAAVSRNYYFRNEILMREKLPRHGNGFRNDLSAVYAILSAKLMGDPFDIIHPTFYFPDYLYRFPALKGGSKTVITVHDFVHERLYPEDKLVIEEKKKALFWADGLICVSEKTRQDLLEFYPELSDKPVTVIYHGFSKNKTSNESNYAFPERYFLFVGQRAEYKNFDIMLKGFAVYKKRNAGSDDVKLFSAGGGTFTKDEITLINDLGLCGDVIQADLSDTELSDAYRKAICFIYPSLYEGFGIPILEAFSKGCPMILSCCSCFPEIARDNAIYFNGSDVEGLAEKMNEIVNITVDQRRQIIDNGYRRLQDFSWEKAADETVSFYKSLL